MRRKLRGAFGGKQRKVVDGETAGEAVGEKVQVEKETRQSKGRQCAEEEGDRVGDTVELGGTQQIIIDIFDKEILELGDSVDWNLKNLRSFEAVHGDAPRDHHFYYSPCSRGSNLEREWRVLHSRSLPPDGLRFFIRAYKGRKELMRVAVAISAPQLPLSHGLFFFDLKFPPSKPPEVHYRSYARAALFPDLSFRSKPFNLSDIFTSIQATLLNPTTDCKHRFACACLAMLDMLRRPPTGFKDLVKGHLRLNAAVILRTFLEEMDMEDEADKTIFFKMYIALEENGAYCQHLLDNNLRQGLKRHKERESSGESSRRCSRAESFWGRFFS